MAKRRIKKRKKRDITIEDKIIERAALRRLSAYIVEYLEAKAEEKEAEA